MIEVQFDGVFDVAEADNRKSKFWKNKEVWWSYIVNKLSKTHRTPETFESYMSPANKDLKDDRKDKGGIVGGYLTGGRRKKGHVLHRQLIMLDLDNASKGFWFDFVLSDYDCAAALYTTHSHSPEKPRMRLVIPLDRHVDATEYLAITKRIADDLGIDMFDPSTYEPMRLMYWPSTSIDGEFLFEFQDAPWLSADKVLATYKNWADSSEWPEHDKVKKMNAGTLKKELGDPLSKPDLIGAFCRTYSITDAIETFLADVYSPTNDDNRFTYVAGSTAGGLVVYDDLFAYSHHSTDPVSQISVNAFDLVRIHLFGLMDADVKEKTPINRWPSHAAMLAMVRDDERVSTLLFQERTQEINDAFKDIPLEDEIEDDASEAEAEAEEDAKWCLKLEKDTKGRYLSTINNILIILANDKKFKGRIAYDDFEKCEVAIKNLPWRRVNHQSRRLTDMDDASIRYRLEKVYGINSEKKTRDAMQVWDTQTKFHPVTDYLSSLKWDGKERVDSLLIDYQGAADTAYTRTVTRKILVAAITRVFKPGAKFDHVLTLVGKQGLKKSTLIAKLGKQWFSDSFSTIKGTAAFEQLQGVWLVEIAELAGLGKAEVEVIKHFITKKEDRYRVAYGHRTENFPRQCVFFATTNKRDFLRDPTGDRRYWPVLVNETTPEKDVFKDLTEAVVDQIWAEAMVFYNKGESIYLSDKMNAEALKIQKDHTEEHPWMGQIKNYLDMKLPEDWATKKKHDRRSFIQGWDQETVGEGVKFRDRVCIQEIWYEALVGRTELDERSAQTIRNLMLNIEGWDLDTSLQRYSVYGSFRKGYRRTSIPNEILEGVEALKITKTQEN